MRYISPCPVASASIWRPGWIGRPHAWISPMQLIRSEVIGDTNTYAAEARRRRTVSRAPHGCIGGDASTTLAHSRIGRRTGRTCVASFAHAWSCTNAVYRRYYISSVRCRKSTAVPFKFRLECNRPVGNSRCTWTFSWVSGLCGAISYLCGILILDSCLCDDLSFCYFVC